MVQQVSSNRPQRWDMPTKAPFIAGVQYPPRPRCSDCREFGQIGTRRTIRWPANSSTDAHLVPSPNPGSLTFFLSQRNIISDPMPTNAAPEALQHWSSSLSMRLFSTPTRIVSTWVTKSQADTSLRWR
jgi:hypothetical protein